MRNVADTGLNILIQLLQVREIAQSLIFETEGLMADTGLNILIQLLQTGQIDSPFFSF